MVPMDKGEKGSYMWMSLNKNNTFCNSARFAALSEVIAAAAAAAAAMSEALVNPIFSVRAR